MNSLFDPKRFLLKLRTHWPLWLAMVLLVFAAGNMAGLLIPKKYRSEAQLQVISPRPELVPRGQSAPLDPQDQVRVVRETMTSPRFLATVVTRLNLYPGLDPASAEYQQHLRGIAQRLEIYPRPNDLIRLSYVDFEPERTALILQTIIDQWRDLTGQRITARTELNVEFLSQRYNDAELRYKEAQRAALLYREQNKTLFETDHQRQRDELVRTRMGLEQTITGLRQSIQLEQARLARERPTIVTARRFARENPEIFRLQSELGALERNLSLLLEDYTEEHRNVVALKRQIEGHRESLAKAMENEGVLEETEEQPNPAYLAIQDRIHLWEAEVAQREDQVRQIGQQLATIDTYLDELPQHQVALANLQADESAVRGQMTELRNQLLAAQIALEIERQGYGASYEEITRAEMPLAPITPKKGMIAAASAAGGLGAGVGVIWLLMLLDVAVRSVEEARGVLRMPVLGVVQRIQTIGQQARERRRRRRLVGMGATATLLLLMAVAGLFWGEQIRSSLLALLG